MRRPFMRREYNYYFGLLWIYSLADLFDDNDEMEIKVGYCEHGDWVAMETKWGSFFTEIT